MTFTQSANWRPRFCELRSQKHLYKETNLLKYGQQLT